MKQCVVVASSFGKPTFSNEIENCIFFSLAFSHFPSDKFNIFSEYIIKKIGDLSVLVSGQPAMHQRNR